MMEEYPNFEQGKKTNWFLIITIFLIILIITSIFLFSFRKKLGFCNENWECNNWSECSIEAQSRECVDLNSCETTNDKPKEIQSCTITQGCVSNFCKEHIISNKNTSKTLDMVIISSDVKYGDSHITYNNEEFLEDANTFIETLFTVSPFNKHKEKFNFYIYNKSLICYLNDREFTSCGLEIGKDIAGLSKYNQEIGYFDVYLILEPREGGGLGGTVIIGKGKTQSTNIHELGHYFGLGHTNFTIVNTDLMNRGGNLPLYFTESHEEIVDSKLKNWRDCFSFEEGIYTSYSYDREYYCGLE